MPSFIQPKKITLWDAYIPILQMRKQTHEKLSNLCKVTVSKQQGWDFFPRSLDSDFCSQTLYLTVSHQHVLFCARA